LILAQYINFGVILLACSYVVLVLVGGHDYRKYGRLRWYTIFLQLLVFCGWGGFPYIYGPVDWPTVHVVTACRIVGNVLLYGGLVLMFASMGWLGLLKTFGQDQNRLRTTGLYAISRNPQCIGCISYAIGFAILWPSWYALGWVLILLILLHFMIIPEEKHLANTYGEDYVEYKRRVPRFLGIPRRTDS